MLYTVSNDFIQLTVNDIGAEMWEIIDKRDRISRLWDGNSKIWAKRSPTLFPIVGTVKNNKMFIDGRVYDIGKHGFLRLTKFEIVEVTNESIMMAMTSNFETRKIYPYDFLLTITYAISGSNVSVKWDIVNKGNSDMPFQIGGHPAFRIPISSDEGFEDYKICFSSPEKLISFRINSQGGITNIVTNFGDKITSIPLRYSYFSEDALIFKGLKSDSVSVISGVSGKGVKMNIGGIPYLGIWTMPNANAPYICLEPWYGVNSKESDDELFVAKDGLNHIAPNSTWASGYSFDIL